MTQEELNNIIEKHQHWLNEDCNGWESMRADLRGADFSNIDLIEIDFRGVDLRSANLNEANLQYANLSDADLRGAKLFCANLEGANLRNACLSNACLNSAILIKSNLSDAILKYADLYNASLQCADLKGAILKNANLMYADLRGAKLNGCDFEFANLSCVTFDDSEICRLGTILTEPINGYKKTAEGNVIELEIPEGAVVFSINNNKCRTNKAIVKKCDGIQHSICNSKFIYKEGDELNLSIFDLRYNVECGRGIHFFKTIEEAEKYNI